MKYLSAIFIRKLDGRRWGLGGALTLITKLYWFATSCVHFRNICTIWFYLFNIHEIFVWDFDLEVRKTEEGREGLGREWHYVQNLVLIFVSFVVFCSIFMYGICIIERKNIYRLYWSSKYQPTDGTLSLFLPLCNICIIFV